MPLVEEDDVRKHLSKMNIHKVMWTDKLYTQVPRELADVTRRPL